MTSPEISFRDKSQRLQELIQTMLARRRLIVASNRGPLEFNLAADGSLVSERGSGGVVTALTGASHFVPITWVASAINEGDRKAAQSAIGELMKVPDLDIYVRFVVVPRPVYQRFYYVFANPLLWFLQHYMWNTPRTPNIGRAVYTAWEDGYLPLNQAFARAIVEETKGDDEPPYVMLHDYHLYLAAADIRQEMPQSTILHFTHIPWPGFHYWGIMPDFMRRAIHESLCAADVVGMQTIRDVRNFLHCCEAMLPEAVVDLHECSVTYREHTTHVCSYPISIDAAGLLEFAESSSVKGYQEQLMAFPPEKLVIRVDRAEPSKNIIRGLRAWELLLERYPELRGKISFLHFLVPTRTELGLYQAYSDEIFELVDSINDQYGDDEWQPVRVFYENNYTQAIAAMKLYDVLFVNPIIDGMNLVSKEGPLVNERDGVLILSEMAGSHEQLGEYVLSVCPTDLEGTVQALYQALTMPGDERRRRAAALKRLVQEEDITFWLERQLRDLSAISRGGL